MKYDSRPRSIPNEKKVNRLYGGGDAADDDDDGEGMKKTNERSKKKIYTAHTKQKRSFEGDDGDKVGKYALGRLKDNRNVESEWVASFVRSFARSCGWVGWWIARTAQKRDCVVACISI